MYKPVWTRQKRSVEKCSFPPWTYPQENLPGCRIPKEIRLGFSNRQSASEPVSLREALENSSRAHAAAHAHGYHAVAPPFTLTRAGSKPASLITANDCAANASFNSITSI